VEGRAWIEALPPELARQRGLLLRLLEAVEPDERIRAYELQCSVARGVGDELSDLDAGLWVADEQLTETIASLPGLLRTLGEPIDLLEQPEADNPYFFVQYADGTQLDLLVLRASTAKGRVPTAVVLLDRDGLLSEPWEPRTLRATPADRRGWAFLAWLALLNLDKYLRRGSLWEARAQLEEARTQLLRLHAERLGIPYPEFGLTSLLDEPEPTLPDGLEATVAGLDARELRGAALALAAQLESYDPPPLARYARTRLAEAADHGASVPARVLQERRGTAG
jgi:Streptomycin adenylyltransferase